MYVLAYAARKAMLMIVVENVWP